jgi:hypothetical protein
MTNPFVWCSANDGVFWPVGKFNKLLCLLLLSLSPIFSSFFSVHCIVNMVSRQSSPVICFCFFPFAVLPLLNDRFVLERLQLLQAETALHRRGGQFASWAWKPQDIRCI